MYKKFLISLNWAFLRGIFQKFVGLLFQEHIPFVLINKISKLSLEKKKDFWNISWINDLFGIESPWPCTKSSLKKQIKHWRSRMISRNLDSEIYSSSNYNLIAEDNIQKIISAINLPKVPLLFSYSIYLSYW